jgi:hypothetical protein
MHFNSPYLNAAVRAGCASKEPSERAVAHNFKWDERLGPKRIAAFEDEFPPATPEFSALAECYRSYFTERVEWDGKSVPGDTFQPVNDGAMLEQLPDARIGLVRLVKIHTSTLITAGLTESLLADIVKLLKGAQNSNDMGEPIRQARAKLRKFVDVWNTYDERPPAFAGLATDPVVATALTASDWADQLRRRFGLGHIHVPHGADRIPVMLLRYTVGEVLAATRRYCRPEFALRVPTVLEANFYQYFFPSPTPFPYGRTVDLDGGRNPRQLTCELVHLPMDLSPDHIDCVGWIEPGTPEMDLAKLRDDHLELLRTDTNRHDFGEAMVEHAVG